MRAVASVALQLVRAVEETLLKGATHNLIVRSRSDVAIYVLNHKRAHLRMLEERFKISVAINVDPAENQAEVEKFVKENGISFTILRDPELSLPPVYELSGFPETFFIGKDGKFLKFNDPGDSSTDVRVVGDRAWDSQNFLKAVSDVLSGNS